MGTSSDLSPLGDTRRASDLLDDVVNAPEDHRGGPDQAPDEADLDSDEE